MRVPIYQIDAFTARRHAGNPAAAVLFERCPADMVLQAIAAGRYAFSPEGRIEVDAPC